MLITNIIFVYITGIRIVVGQNYKPNYYCQEDYPQLETDTINCPKNWSVFTEATITFALTESEQLLMIYDNLLAHVSSFMHSCPAKVTEPGREHSLRHHHRTSFRPYAPCGSMSVNLLPVEKLKKWEIRIQKEFAVNVTFVIFYLDDPMRSFGGGENCTYNYITIQYYNQTGLICNTWSNKHCSWRPPWSLIVPSHHVLIWLHSAIVLRKYHIQFVYQVVEKCHNYAHQLRSHDVVTIMEPIFQLFSNKLFFNHVITYKPGFSLMITIYVCMYSEGTTVQVCDGPLLVKCTDMELRCRPRVVNVIMYSSIVRVNRVRYHDQDNLYVSYITKSVVPVDVHANITQQFHVASKNNSLFHKVWKIHAPFAVDIIFNIKTFVGYTERNCQFGGITFYTVATRILDGFINHRRNMLNDSLFDRLHGPFCSSLPDIPFTGASELSNITLPNGTHVLVMHSFMKQFKLDLLVNIVPNKGCSGLLNLCDLCYRMAVHSIFEIQYWDHISHFYLQCHSWLQNNGIISVNIGMMKHHHCLKIQHVSGEQFPCNVSVRRMYFSHFFDSKIAIQADLIPPMTNQYMIDSKCSHDIGKVTLTSSTGIKHYLQKNISHSYTGHSPTWHLHQNNVCGYQYAMIYTIHYEETNIVSCAKYQPTKLGSFYNERHTVCGAIISNKPGRFTFMFDLESHRYNVNIQRTGICKSHDLVRIMYGLLERVLNQRNCTYEGPNLEYETELYHTLLINFTEKRLAFVVPSRAMLIQIVKTSNVSCSLLVKYEVVSVEQHYLMYERYSLCVAFDGLLPKKENQVKYMLT